MATVPIGGAPAPVTYSAIERFCRDVMGDPRFVLDMRNGRIPRPETAAKIRQFTASLGEA